MRKMIVTIILSTLALFVGVAIFKFQMNTSRQAKTGVEIDHRPLVKTQSFKSQDYTVKITGYGNVEPRHEVTVNPEISGAVTSVSDNFDIGKMVCQGETLITIEDTNYRLILASAQAALEGLEHQHDLLLKEEENTRANVKIISEMVELAKAELDRNSRLLAKASVSQSVVDQQHSAYLGNLSSLQAQKNALATYKPRMAQIQSQIDAAKANVEKAQTDLGRTVIKAPFAGIVVERDVERGNVVNTNSKLGVIYGIDVARIRVPVPVNELKWLKSQTLVAKCSGATTEAPVGTEALMSADVTLAEGFQGVVWQGSVMASGGQVDPSTRTMDFIVEVQDPFCVDGADKDRPALAKGMFCKVDFHARDLKDVYILPRQCVSHEDTIRKVVEGKVVIQKVNVLRVLENSVVIEDSITEQDQIVMTRTTTLVEGTEVRVAAH